ncbi:hypothetical protein Droror1_Dr00025835 [Drosera rotundifolia]
MEELNNEGKKCRDLDFDDDDGGVFEWVVDFNDTVLERFDAALDEFEKERDGKGEDGFEVVRGKNKKRGREGEGVRVVEREKRVGGGTVKAKVPFHIPTIRRSQDEFNILVNNSNEPFRHVWLERSEDDSRFIHPLENHSVMDFVDRDIEGFEPVKPLPIESTPFKLIEEVKDLKILASKLRSVNEFSVDLEHNQYRSFQGLTCLMQISTRSEDFVIDTLKLRVHIGPYLREVFKDPSKKKVMHGADKDILWLQRDFGIYVCNMFDTGQASRVLKMERYSLEFLLLHLCGVTANKQYQNAEWRLRPLPSEMLRYARDDTHYLLYIYDLLRAKLLSTPRESEESDTPIVEVYNRSYNLCMQLYDKELLTETSYLHMHGLHGANFNAQQLSVVAGLYEWRDITAREEDESTGFILPNKTLLEIGKQMPVTTSKLRQLVWSKLPYVERNLGSVVNIIRHSIQNASEFEAIAKKMNESRNGAAPELTVADGEGSEALEVSQASMGLAAGENPNCGSACNEHVTVPVAVNLKKAAKKPVFGEVKPWNDGIGISFPDQGRRTFAKKHDDDDIPKFLFKNFPQTWMTDDINAIVPPVQVLRKPTRAFGALLGNSSSKIQSIPVQKGKDERLMEQIKSSMKLPFHSFSGPEKSSKQDTRVSSERNPMMRASTSKHESVLVEDIIMLDDGSDFEEKPFAKPAASHESPEPVTDSDDDLALIDEVYEELSLSDISSGLQKCFDESEARRMASQPCANPG